MVENLTKCHEYWVFRVDNVYILGAKELWMVLDVLRAHKAIFAKKN